MDPVFSSYLLVSLTLFRFFLTAAQVQRRWPQTLLRCMHFIVYATTWDWLTLSVPRISSPEEESWLVEPGTNVNLDQAWTTWDVFLPLFVGTSPFPHQPWPLASSRCLLFSVTSTLHAGAFHGLVNNLGQDIVCIGEFLGQWFRAGLSWPFPLSPSDAPLPFQNRRVNWQCRRRMKRSNDEVCFWPRR